MKLEKIFIVIAVLICQSFGSDSTANFKKKLFIEVKSLGYLDNLEYTTKIRDGETIFGTQFRPSLRIQINPSVAISGGIFLNRRFGDTLVFTDVLPLVNLQLIFNNIRFRFGDLALDSLHNLPDIVYARERKYAPGFEEGLQFQFNNNNVSHEIWIDWNRLNTSMSQEQFTFGTSNLFKYKFLELPIIITGTHKGGEQFHFDSLAVQDSYLFTSGLKLLIKVNPNVAIDAHSLYNRSFRRDRGISKSYNDGWALSNQLSLNIYGIKLTGIFNNSNNFFTPLGNALFTAPTLFGTEIIYMKNWNFGMYLNGGVGYYLLNNLNQYRFWLLLKNDIQFKLNR